MSMDRLPLSVPLLSPRIYLDDAVAATTHHQSSVLTPHNGAYTFTPHYTMARYHLRADPFLKVPEADRGIMAGRNGFPSVA